MEFSSSAAGPWSTTTIYIDGLRSTSGIVHDTFDGNIGRMVSSTLMNVEGATLTWLDAIP
jgi:hypothetical protein